MSPLAKGALYAAIVAAGAVAGLLLYRQFAPEPAPATLTPPAEAIPAVRPVFSLVDRDGQLRSITDWDGKALVINFWATWCPPCRREIPMLNDLQREYGPRGYEVIGIAVDFREQVLEYLQTTPVVYPMLIGEQDGLDAAQAFGMESMGFPFTIFTDTQGRIVTVHVGELHRPEADAILTTVARVSAGELTPVAAKAVISDKLAALSAKKT